MLNPLQAESVLCLVRDQKNQEEDPRVQINSVMSQPTYGVSDTNLILRSPDLIDFRVHKSVLATVSPFFKDLLSLPQLFGGESVDGFPVIRLLEDSELLNSLVLLLYPFCTVVPKSYDKVCTCSRLVNNIFNSYYKVLYLLAACQKYDMALVQSSIRIKVKLGGFPAPEEAESFSAYAIAGGNELVPEMENAAQSDIIPPHDI